MKGLVAAAVTVVARARAQRRPQQQQLLLLQALAVGGARVAPQWAWGLQWVVGVLLDLAGRCVVGVGGMTLPAKGQHWHVARRMACCFPFTLHGPHLWQQRQWWERCHACPASKGVKRLCSCKPINERLSLI